ncbi:gamma-glutamyltransferase [Qipengyuania sp. ASV99]|uniref:gamma-glutamyltransferase n=1 Tax=Qipengyuania sp. ASV99 TaxID=3399681 RepID=UPI003A4C76DB
MTKLVAIFARVLASIALVSLAIPAHSQHNEIVENLSPRIQQPVYGSSGMVVSQNGLASEVGAQVLRDGGNAIDAAVATGFALAVTLPRAGNIGGGGFMVVYLGEERRSLVIDYRTIAPAAARTEMYIDSDGNESAAASSGYIAPSVPGTVAGLYHAHQRYGRLPWERVVAPAIRLAEEGFALSHEHVAVFAAGKGRIMRSDAAFSAYFKPDGSAYAPGEILRQPDMAWTLRQISQFGANGFYSGEVARKIAEDMARHGGLITQADLSAYRPIEREAVSGTYRGLTVISAPPVSSGGTALIEMLNLLEPYDLASMGAGSAASLHLLSEVMKLGTVDRRKYIGDPAFFRLPVEQLISKEYARERGQRISLTRALHPRDHAQVDPWSFESQNTTHFSVADAEGNAVSNTYTLGSDFGSGVMVEGAGFLLDNQMNNFSHEVAYRAERDGRQAPVNALAPGKRMSSSMTPTIILKDNQPWLVTGSPGGSTIIGNVLQVIVGVVDFGLNAAEATNQPRIHQEGTNLLSIEQALNPDTQAILSSMGHELRVSDFAFGSAQTIMIEPGNRFSGAADPRRPDALAVAP